MDAGGQGPRRIPRAMLSDRGSGVIVDFPSSAECFPGVEIKGGVCYFLWDRDHDGRLRGHHAFERRSRLSVQPIARSSEFDVFVRDNRALCRFLKKVLAEGRAVTRPNICLADEAVRHSRLRTFDGMPTSSGTRRRSVYLHLRIGKRGRLDRSRASRQRTKSSSTSGRCSLPQAYGGTERSVCPTMVLGKPSSREPGISLHRDLPRRWAVHSRRRG